MSISHGDQLFISYEADKVPIHGRYSYFGNNYGTVVGFRDYIDGYIFAVRSLYSEYISCKRTRIDILDTIVYPLCFNYRQIVELYIKYFFFKYSGTNDDEKEKFIKRVSHRLCIAWTEARAHIKLLHQKIGSSIDITLFDDFIKQIDDFDSDSFRMRYPIKKDLSPTHGNSIKLDVVGLHSKMLAIFDLFHQLDSEIDGVLIDNNCEIQFVRLMKSLYENARVSISAIVDVMRQLANREKIRREETHFSVSSCIDISEINFLYDTEQIVFENMVLELPIKHAVILALLTHAGSYLVNHDYKLAVNEELTKDFFKLLEITLINCSHFIDLDGKYPCNVMCYAILEKSAEVPLEWLQTSIPIMEHCIET